MKLIAHEKIERRGERVDKTHECLLQASKCNNGGGVIGDGSFGGLGPPLASCPGLSPVGLPKLGFKGGLNRCIC